MNNNSLGFSLVIAAALCIACQAPEPPDTGGLALPSDADRAAGAISEDLLRSAIDALADDALAGRAPASEGDKLARDYMAEQLEKHGFGPGNGSGGWEQPVEMVGLTSAMPESWTIRGADGEVELRFWDDYIGATGVVEPEVSIDSAEIVFVGLRHHGAGGRLGRLQGRRRQRQAAADAQQRPRLGPPICSAASRVATYGRWTYKYESAARAGAVGAIVIHTTPSAGYGFNVVQSSWTGEQFVLPRLQAGSAGGLGHRGCRP